jgi:hypothetical protein
MTSRDDHIQAAGFAGIAIEEFQQALLAARAGAGEQAAAAVHNALGDGGDGPESARNAQAFLAGAFERLDEVTGILEACKAEMTRYSGGF